MKPPSKISNHQAIALVIIAVLFDLIGVFLNLVGFIPVAGQIVAWPLTILNSFISYIVFGLWFLILGIGFLNPRRAITSLIGITVEFIPVLNALPILTIGVIVSIMTVWAEEKFGQLGLPMPPIKPKTPVGKN